LNHPFFIMLAQADISTLPAGFLKDVIIVMVAAIILMTGLMTAVFMGLQYFLERRRIAREEAAAENPGVMNIGPTPLPVTKVYPTATLRDLNDHGRRLDDHDKQLNSLWTTMREEDKQIRAEQAAQYQSISLALGRIEGKLSKE